MSRAEAKGGLYRTKEARFSDDGRYLYITGIAEIACEDEPGSSCVSGRPFGLQVVEVDSMRIEAEFEGISRIAVTADGARIVGIGSELDFRGVEDGYAPRTGFGLAIIDGTTFELIAHVEPETAFEDVAVSPDGRYAYLRSDGAGVDPTAPYDCNEACKLLTVVDLDEGNVVATRTFDGPTIGLVSLTPQR